MIIYTKFCKYIALPVGQVGTDYSDYQYFDFLK